MRSPVLDLTLQPLPSETMERCANPSTQLDINHAILDYLLYTAIKALLENCRATKRKNDGPVKQGASLYLQMVECKYYRLYKRCNDGTKHPSAFLVMFRSMHPNHHGTAEIQFRLRLLKFTSMFTARFALAPIEPSPSGLQAMRRQNKQRAHAFGHTVDLADVMELDIVDQDNFTSETTGTTKQSARSLYPTSGGISLLDTLPSFMALSATQSVLQDSPITDIWMRLAAGYMAHAALEQSLVHGLPFSDALTEAFAWGFDAESTAEEGSDEWQINAMFLGEDEEIVGWSEIKDEHMQAVSLHAQLVASSARSPMHSSSLLLALL